jgi:hypothetical protein
MVVSDAGSIQEMDPWLTRRPVTTLFHANFFPNARRLPAHQLGGTKMSQKIASEFTAAAEKMGPAPAKASNIAPDIIRLENLIGKLRKDADTGASKAVLRATLIAIGGATLHALGEL